MARRKSSFTEADLKRALHAAKAAGVPVQVSIEDGRMVVTMLDRAKPVACEHPANSNEWDEVFKDGKD